MDAKPKPETIADLAGTFGTIKTTLIYIAIVLTLFLALFFFSGEGYAVRVVSMPRP